MREARIRVAAQWREGDLGEIVDSSMPGMLSLDGLITHRRPAVEAACRLSASRSTIPSCLKMVLDWRSPS